MISLVTSGLCFFLALTFVESKAVSKIVGKKHEVHTDEDILSQYIDGCKNDGFYYRDEGSFIICSNGLAYVQYCAPGSRNADLSVYRDDAYKHHFVFCGENFQHYRHLNLIDYYPDKEPEDISYKEETKPSKAYKETTHVGDVTYKEDYKLPDSFKRDDYYEESKADVKKVESYQEKPVVSYEKKDVIVETYQPKAVSKTVDSYKVDNSYEGLNKKNTFDTYSNSAPAKKTVVSYTNKDGKLDVKATEYKNLPKVKDSYKVIEDTYTGDNSQKHIDNYKPADSYMENPVDVSYVADATTPIQAIKQKKESKPIAYSKKTETFDYGNKPSDSYLSDGRKDGPHATQYGYYDAYFNEDGYEEPYYDYADYGMPYGLKGYDKQISTPPVQLNRYNPMLWPRPVVHPRVLYDRNMMESRRLLLLKQLMAAQRSNYRS